MAGGDTRTGHVLEQMVLPALRKGGYQVRPPHVHIGTRFGGGKHLVDVVATDTRGQTYLISLKWQQVSGTAEQKVPFEAICLAQAVRDGQGTKAYLVLGGNGWKLKSFYISGGLSSHLVYGHLVTIIDLYDFVALANRTRL